MFRLLSNVPGIEKKLFDDHTSSRKNPSFLRNSLNKHFLILVLSVFLLSALLAACSDSGQSPTTVPDKAASNLNRITNNTTTTNPKLNNDASLKQKAVDLLAKTPMHFAVNVGQDSSEIKFQAQGMGYNLALYDDASAALQLQPVHPNCQSADSQGLLTDFQAKNQSENSSDCIQPPSQLIQLQLAGANPHPVALGQQLQEYRTNYIIGNDPAKWHTDVSNYGRVQYQSVYPGIDMVYYGQEKQLEYDFLVAPHADTSAISLQFSGAEQVKLDAASGDLILHLANGTDLRQVAPHLYQQSPDGKRYSVSGSYVSKAAGNNFGFKIGPEYNPDLPLTIDPTFGYSTYYGGNGLDIGYGIAVDSSGNAYIGGQTGSNNLPIVGGIPPTGFKGTTYDAFVVKLNPDATAEIYSTYLGGTKNDFGTSIAVDSSGKVYLGGYTNSTDFPIVNGYQTNTAVTNATSFGFLAVINAAGNALTYSTYLVGGLNGLPTPGKSQNRILGVAADNSGNAYVTGYTNSVTFPTQNALQTTNAAGGNDPFVTKFNTNLSGAGSLVYSTYLGGNSTGSGNGIAIDGSGYAYIVGNTSATNLPVTNAVQTTNAGGTDAFVAKLGPSGNSLAYLSYLGTTGTDAGNAIALDSTNKAYVTGEFAAAPAGSITPTAGSYQTAFTGTQDAFIIKLDMTLSGPSSLIYSTLYGSSAGAVTGYGIAVNSSNQVWLTGNTNSTLANTGPGSFESSFIGGANTEGFLFKLSADAKTSLFNTYLGGSSGDTGRAVAVDNNTGFAYVTGQTLSTNFPTTSGVVQPTHAADTSPTPFDAFVVKLEASKVTADPNSTYQYASPGIDFYYPIQVNYTDSLGKTPSGVTITLQAPTSGASGTFDCTAGCSGTGGGTTTYTDTTNSSGQFANPPKFKANAISSPYLVYYTITATVVGGTGDVFYMYNTTTPYANGVAQLVANSSSLSFNSTTTHQNLSLAASGQNINWTSQINYGSGAKDWLSLSQSNGSILENNSTSLTVTANPAGLQTGTYNANITFQDIDRPANNSKVNVTLIVSNSGAYTYYLPFVANNANGYTSEVKIQNVGTASANIVNQFYDASGSNISTQAATCSTLAVNGACSAANPFSSGTQGTGVISSDQPLSVLVQESTPFGSSAYGVNAGASNSLVAPLAINDNGGFNTQLTVANVGTSAVTASVNFYDLNGNKVSNATKSLNLAAHSSQSLDQHAADSALPAGFYGWAQISVDGSASGNGQLVAQVLETRSDIKFTALANATGSSDTAHNSSKLFAPAIFKGAFGHFFTGANIINPAASPVQVNITYHDSTGKAYVAAPFTIPAHGVAPIYQGANSGNGIPANGLPDNFYGSATVETGSSASVVMVVNESGDVTPSGAAQSGTYAAASGTGSTGAVGLPVVANAGNGYISGATILNTADTGVSGTISYYNPDGVQVGQSQSFTIPAHASQPIYQGAAGLPQGFYGQALITSGSNSLLVTTNVQNSSLFFSYTSPN